MGTDATCAKLWCPSVTRGRLSVPFCNNKIMSVNVGLCLLVTNAPQAHHSAPADWGSQPFGPNQNWDSDYPLLSFNLHLSKEVWKVNFRQCGQIAQPGRSSGMEKVKGEDKRRRKSEKEKVRRDKLQVREKVGKSRNTVFSDVLWFRRVEK